MTTEKLAQLFKDHEDEFLKFARVEKKFSKRADLHAFILLDTLVPGSRDMVSAAEHDEIYLDVSLEEVAITASEDDVINLIRCGVRYDSEYDSLCMFV